MGIIQEQPAIRFKLHATYQFQGKPTPPGDYSVQRAGEKIIFDGESYSEITFESDQLHEDSFELKEVVIGVGFHWERKENQRFQAD